MGRAEAVRRRGEGIARAVLGSLRSPPAVADPPLVSVVIATYEWPEVLRWAIASVRAQRYPRWELIVVGDGCGEESEALVASFGDARIRWHNRATNSGSQSLPNNDGIALARGELVAYLGHDDLWTPDHLARLVAAQRRAEADVAFSLTEVIGPPGSGMRNVSGFLPGGYRGGHLPPSSLLHRRALVDRMGGWRDYREIEQPPDTELLERAHRAGAAFACSWALTAFKLPSAMRPGSYRERRSDEQEALAARMRRERLFQMRELSRAVASRVRQRGEDPNRFAPQVGPEDGKGAYVRAARRVRGLDP
jgi:glycosyltransferase involved in cell wall biosynthesis